MTRGSLSGSCPGKVLGTVAFELGLGCQTFLASAKSQRQGIFRSQRVYGREEWESSWTERLKPHHEYHGRIWWKPLNASVNIANTIHSQARTLEWVAIFLLQGIFLTQGLNLGLLYYRRSLCHWATGEAPGLQQQWFSAPLLHLFATALFQDLYSRM